MEALTLTGVEVRNLLKERLTTFAAESEKLFEVKKAKPTKNQWKEAKG